MFFQRMPCSVLMMTGAAIALQTSKDAGANEWNPLSYLHSLTASENALKVVDMKPYVQPEGNRSKPRMLVSSGCDAASGIAEHAHAILELHGIHTPKYQLRTLHDKVDSLLDNTDNRVLLEAGEGHDLACGESCRAMIQAQKYYAGQNTSLVFKAIVGADQDAILSKSLFEAGTLVVLTSRRNKLDQLVCQVRDCFVKQDLGQPEQHGKESDICWNRRQLQPVNYKANLKVAKLEENMLKIDEKMESTRDALKQMGYPYVDTVVSEDLLDFEWNKSAVGPAYNSWSSLLAAWGVHPKSEMIKAYIATNTGTREAPASQKQTIVNFGEVWQFMKNHPRYSWMLRE